MQGDTATMRASNSNKNSVEILNGLNDFYILFKNKIS